MSAISSVVKNFLRIIGNERFPSSETLAQAVHNALDYHAQEGIIKTVISHDAYKKLRDQKSYKEALKHQAIQELAKSILENGFYEATETIKDQGIETTYTIHLLIDRGF